MVTPGSPAPDFECDTSTGRIHLKALRGSPVILYFYPEADTPGCTRESKRFRDLMPSFEAKGVKILGISTDSVPKQQAFAEHCALPFPLVADVSKEITRAYEVLGPAGRARRVSFFLDAKGNVLEVVEARDALEHPAAAERRYLGAASV